MKLLGTLLCLLAFCVIATEKVTAADSKGINVGGFVDAQAHWKKGGGAEGFSIFDGALYVSKEYQHGKVMIDLPFSYAPTTTVTTTTTPATVSQSVENDFEIGKGKAQAYFTYSCVDGAVNSTFGQFDSIFGFEKEDTADLVMARQGFVSNAADVPVTHTGYMLSLKPRLNMNGNLGVNVLVSNASNRGQKNGVNFEYGGQLTFDTDYWRAIAGYVFWDMGSHVRHIMNYQFGATWRLLKVDLEGNLLKDVTDTNDEWGMGFIAQFVSAVHDKADLGLMLEYGKKLKNVYSGWQMMAGPAFHLNEDITIKANYIWNRTKATSAGTNLTTHQLVAAGVYKF